MGVFFDGLSGSFMKNINERTAANMEVVLGGRRALPHGGDHTTGKRVAKKLIYSARHGSTTLSDSWRSRETRFSKVPAVNWRSPSPWRATSRRMRIKPARAGVSN